LDKGLPFHRVREIHAVLEMLVAIEKENYRASDLFYEIKMIRRSKNTNIWWQMVDLFFENYQDETSNSMLPVSRAIDRFYEFTAEQRREKILGHGIFLSTIHSSKGMEFPHVFILDGDWTRLSGKSEWEEERRVMYVGMTRAEETLCLIKTPNSPNPFLREIRGNFVAFKTYPGNDINEGLQNMCYELIGLSEIYMDYAGCFHKNNRIHEHLSDLEAGQRVAFHQNDSSIEIHDSDGCCVAKLSNEGVNNWFRRLGEIQELRVVALLRRDRDDPNEDFISRIKADQWELPILEAVYTPST
jgi:ATP-dependent DNA helicase RecQ